jgi:hypothetical protein
MDKSAINRSHPEKGPTVREKTIPWIRKHRKKNHNLESLETPCWSYCVRGSMRDSSGEGRFNHRPLRCISLRTCGVKHTEWSVAPLSLVRIKASVHGLLCVLQWRWLQISQFPQHLLQYREFFLFVSDTLSWDMLPLGHLLGSQICRQSPVEWHTHHCSLLELVVGLSAHKNPLQWMQPLSMEAWTAHSLPA